MHRPIILSLTTAALCLFPISARAASYISCQTDLVLADCTVPPDAKNEPIVWNVSDPLHLAATCQECSGGGSDISCSPGELATAAALSIVTAADIQPVEGSFAQVGTCSFGKLQFKFSGSLTAGDYLVLVTAPPHEPTEILSFTVGNGGPPPADGGTTPGSDGGTTPGSDGGTTPSTDGGAPSGDGATSGGGEEDSGCDCRTAPGSDNSALSVLLLAAVMLVTRRRRRR